MGLWNRKYLNENKPIPFEILEKCSKKKNAICKITEKLINFKDINKWNNWVIDKSSYIKWKWNPNRF